MHVGFGLRIDTERTAMMRALARAASDGGEDPAAQALAVEALPMYRPIATLVDRLTVEVA
jgi:hypothetical protein